MSSKRLPNEIFAKILQNVRGKGSHRDLKNLNKALDHPELENYQVTFDHFTSRSRENHAEEIRFICPICLFSQTEMYDDSIWEDLCQTIFGCHFILYGGHELVKSRPKRLLPPVKRSLSDSEISKTNCVQFIYSQELLVKRCRQKSLQDTNPFTLSYVKKIHASKGCDKIMDSISKHDISNLKIFKDVGDFIDHLDRCEAHYHKPSLKVQCDENQSEAEILNYDSLYKSKMQGRAIDDISKPRGMMRSLNSDKSNLMSDFILLKQPDSKLFDSGSQNHDFLENILWPILTLAISVQLEDHLDFPTQQFKNIPEGAHHALALRDLLRCICEVTENLEYNFEIVTWVKAKFAALHGMLEILDSYFPEY